MPVFASSWCTASVKLVTNAFVAEYTASPGCAWKLATLDTFKMYPRPRGNMRLTAALVIRMSATTFSCTSFAKRFGSMRCIGPEVPKPALLTTKSTGGFVVSRKRASTAATPSVVSKSAVNTSTFLYLSAMVCKRSPRRATSTIGTPALPNMCAICSPMPLEAPVMSACVNG